jgi:hypothetical protein
MPSLGVKKGVEYIAKDYAHLKNTKLYVQRGSKYILDQVNKLAGEGNRNFIQMKCIFHVCLMVVPHWSLNHSMNFSKV